MRAGSVDKACGALIFGLMVVGGFVLWIGIPGLVLWLLGKAVASRTQHLILGLLAVPLAMALFAVLLAHLNRIYLRVSGFELAGGDDNEWLPRLRGPLDRILGICAIVALLALLLWMVFGDNATGPVSPW